MAISRAPPPPLQYLPAWVEASSCAFWDVLTFASSMASAAGRSDVILGSHAPLARGKTFTRPEEPAESAFMELSQLIRAMGDDSGVSSSLSLHWTLACVAGVSSGAHVVGCVVVGVLLGERDGVSSIGVVNAVYRGAGSATTTEDLESAGALIRGSVLIPAPLGDVGQGRGAGSTAGGAGGTLDGDHGDQEREQAGGEQGQTITVPATLFISPTDFVQLQDWNEGQQRAAGSSTQLHIHGWTGVWHKALQTALEPELDDLFKSRVHLFRTTRVVVDTTATEGERVEQFLRRRAISRTLMSKMEKALEGFEPPEELVVAPVDEEDEEDLVYGRPGIFVMFPTPSPSRAAPRGVHHTTERGARPTSWTAPRAPRGGGAGAGAGGAREEGWAVGRHVPGAAPLHAQDPFYWDQDRRNDRRAVLRPVPHAIVEWRRQLVEQEPEERSALTGRERYTERALHMFMDPERRPGDPRHADLELNLRSVGECLTYVTNTFGARATGVLLAGGCVDGSEVGVGGVVERLDRLVRADPARMAEAPSAGLGLGIGKKDDFLNVASLPRPTTAKVILRVFELRGVVYLLPLFISDASRHDLEPHDILEQRSTVGDAKTVVNVKRDGAYKVFSRLYQESTRPVFSSAMQAWWGFICYWLVAEPLRLQLNSELTALADEAEGALRRLSMERGRASQVAWKGRVQEVLDHVDGTLELYFRQFEGGPRAVVRSLKEFRFAVHLEEATRLSFHHKHSHKALEGPRSGWSERAGWRGGTAGGRGAGKDGPSGGDKPRAEDK